MLLLLLLLLHHMAFMCRKQDVQVADWVIHGLGLPQYAEAFRSNAITVSRCT